jgi:energy-coupling factor transporter ATP-binding protein EcfA2
MFTSVRVKNFRAITDLHVDGLSRVNLFVGHNACGKTTFLESVFFLVGATNPRLPLSANVFRGFPYIGGALWATYFHNMDAGIPIEISASESEIGERHLTIVPRYEYPGTNGTPSAPPDSVDAMRSDSHVSAEMNGLRLECLDSTEVGSPVSSEVFLKEEKVEVRPVTNTAPRPMRGSFVIPFAGDLRDRFSEVQRKKRVQEVVNLLRSIEPTLTDLRLLDPQGGLYADTGAPELIPVYLMGGGILKFVSIAVTMLHLQDGFVLIDEIENGLDSASMGKLWDAIFDWAQKLNVQVFATTHSMECIKAFSDGAEAGLFGADAKLFRIERKEDKFRAVEYTREVLAVSLDSNWEVR